MTSPYNTGPIAPFRNVPIEPQYFQPSQFVIAGITNADQAVVTTSTNNNYVIGQLIRFLIPAAYGMRDINELTAYVIGINSSTEFVTNLNTLHFNTFIPSPSNAPTLPQVVAVGDINSGVISQTGRSLPTTTVPGSFINISPN